VFLDLHHLYGSACDDDDVLSVSYTSVNSVFFNSVYLWSPFSHIGDGLDVILCYLVPAGEERGSDRADNECLT